VNGAAFETTPEANLVDSLRQHARPLISLVAEQDGVVVGHILCSPVSIGDRSLDKLMALRSMAVVPNLQRNGIGSELARGGLERCRELGCGVVFIL
jgi:putative acetyltransferase